MVVKPKKAKVPVQVPIQEPGGPEMWDGNNDGWTKVSYKKKQKK